MRIQKMAFAHSFAITTLFAWTICALGVALFPTPSLVLSKWFMHGLNMETLGIWKVTAEGFFLGGVVLMGFSWVVGYVFGTSLEYFSKK